MSRLKVWLLLRLLEQFHDELVAQGKIPASDAVLDMMDSVSGWTSDPWRLT